MPLGVDMVELPMMFELQRAGIELRDGQQTMLPRAKSRDIDELTLLDIGLGDGGRRVPGHCRGVEAGGARNPTSSRSPPSGCMRWVRTASRRSTAIAGERCSPHPHNFTDRLIRPGDQAFFDIIQSFMGYRTCYYRTFNVGRATPSQQQRLQEGARVDGQGD